MKRGKREKRERKERGEEKNHEVNRKYLPIPNPATTRITMR